MSPQKHKGVVSHQHRAPGLEPQHPHLSDGGEMQEGWGAGPGRSGAALDVLSLAAGLSVTRGPSLVPPGDVAPGKSRARVALTLTRPVFRARRGAGL